MLIYKRLNTEIIYYASNILIIVLPNLNLTLEIIHRENGLPIKI